MATGVKRFRAAADGGFMASVAPPGLPQRDPPEADVASPGPVRSRRFNQKLIPVAALLAVLTAALVWDLARGNPNTRGLRVLTVSNTAAANRLLNAVPVPAGLQRAAGCQPKPSVPSVCFRRVPSLVLSSSLWGRILGQLGVPITSNSGCHAPRVLLPGRITAINCLAFGHIGRQQIWLNAHSIVLVTSAGLRPSSADFGAVGNGTEVNVLDVGS